jgi:hypothetical protein
MRICDYCGEEIEFRYVDGRPTPIHVNGGWCSGYRSSSQQTSTKSFASYVSYVNPNARCPVCGERVYFYQSPFGGRVFFDDLRWPWPKHPCTDNPRSQTGTVKSLTETLHKAFLTSRGEPLQLYELRQIDAGVDPIALKFSRVDQPLVAFRASISVASLNARDITVKDLQEAPSFVIRFYEDHRLVEFISGRKQKIESLRVPRQTAQPKFQ